MRRRAAGTGVAVLLLAGGAVGCGEGAEQSRAGTGEHPAMPATPAAAVAEAAKNVEDITSLHYRLTGTVPQRGAIEVDASMATKPASMTMKMTGRGRQADEPLRVRFVDKVMYVTQGAVTAAKTGGRNWIALRPAMWGGGAVDNVSYGLLPQQIEGSPLVQSTMLTGSKDVRRIGPETIDGTRTTHYRGTVTFGGLSAARDAAKDKATRESRIRSLDHFVALRVDKTLTVDLWIDGNNQARQFRLRGDSHAPQGGTARPPREPAHAERLDMTVTFLDIDPPVTVRAPSAGDTADAEDLAEATRS